jgi:hypothetical protein
MAIHFVTGHTYLAAGDAPFGVPNALIKAAAGGAGFQSVEVFDANEVPVPADAPMEGVDTVVRGVWSLSDGDLEPPTGIFWVYDVTGPKPLRVFPAPQNVTPIGPPAPQPPIAPQLPQLPPNISPAVPPFNPQGQAQPVAPEKDKEHLWGWQYAAVGVGAVLVGSLLAVAVSRRS